MAAGVGFGVGEQFTLVRCGLYRPSGAGAGAWRAGEQVGEDAPGECGAGGAGGESQGVVGVVVVVDPVGSGERFRLVQGDFVEGGFQLVVVEGAQYVQAGLALWAGPEVEDEGRAGSGRGRGVVGCHRQFGAGAVPRVGV
ncbi:hypothetical protein EES44_29965 [Streptomyces sp. ADI96-15]|nr:hypothetical protein EES44_29965 [Streptomyces sp. ADI96-15]